MPRKKNKSRFPQNLLHAVGEFFPEGFVLFAIEPESRKPKIIAMSPNGSALLALNTFIRYYSESMEEAQKENAREFFIGGEEEKDEGIGGS